MTPIVLPSQIALRSHGASTRPSRTPLLALGREGARQPEERREDDRDPEQAGLGALRRAAREREVEDRQRRDDEEQHRRQRVARAQLEQQVLARERRDVSGVRAHASASLAVARAASASGSCVATSAVTPARSASSACEQLGALDVEPVERLVEEQQVGVVEKRPAEREPLEHPARERPGPLVPHSPEPEALEHRARTLAPLGQPVEPAVEVEVLERRQLPVDERLVREEPDRAARARRPRARRPSARRAPRRGAARSSSRTRSAR